jgi:hypothetical protein
MKLAIDPDMLTCGTKKLLLVINLKPLPSIAALPFTQPAGSSCTYSPRHSGTKRRAAAGCHPGEAPTKTPQTYR